MIWKFELDAVEIDEPIGFSEIVFTILRDELWHGVFIEASTSQLGFYGPAYTILKAAKENYGVDANVIFTASNKCEDEAEFTEAISGRLNFAQYQETCGNECIIRLSVEQDTCAMVFKNRFNQKVNIDSNAAFNKQTLLEDYTGLRFNMPLATQIIPISADASVATVGDQFLLTTPSGVVTLVRPIYQIVTDNSINTGQLNDPVSNFQQVDDYPFISPQVLLEENELCVPGEWAYNVRMKGSITVTGDGLTGMGSYIVFGYWNGDAIIYNVITDIEPEVTIQLNMVSGVTYYFDHTFTGTVSLPVGAGVYAFVKQFALSSNDRTYDINFDPETSFFLSNNKECPPTNCDVYMINETLARATESITDRCLTVYSEYYGRTDSEPYDFPEDGCGGLRIFTPGLKIRQATDKEFFASMEELMLGLRAIDNIGMGMEVSPDIPDAFCLRVEPAEYFYQNVKLLSVPFVPQNHSVIEEKMVYSNILSGYNKWEIKSIKGIDEFCSYKERRTGIKFVNNELDISTDLIASGYIIENLRTSTLVNTGQTDNTYDNDVFIICVDRDTTPQERETFFGVSTPGQFFFPMADGNFLRVGSVVAISGTALNNGNYTISAIIDDGYYFYFTTVEATVIEGPVSATLTAVSGYFGTIEVEQGGIGSAANFYSPATAYNWRIRPLYNLMRWFKSIAQSYVNLANTASKIFFTSGKGNYLAEGTLNIYGQDPCSLENKVLAENADISASDFNSVADATPIYKPETLKFTYPLSIADYIAIKAIPYGYIDVQCGNGNFEKAFIKSIEYKPAQGEANFTLIKKWQ